MTSRPVAQTDRGPSSEKRVDPSEGKGIGVATGYGSDPSRSLARFARSLREASREDFELRREWWPQHHLWSGLATATTRARALRAVAQARRFRQTTHSGALSGSVGGDGEEVFRSDDGAEFREEDVRALTRAMSTDSGTSCSRPPIASSRRSAQAEVAQHSRASSPCRSRLARMARPRGRRLRSRSQPGDSFTMVPGAVIPSADAEELVQRLLLVRGRQGAVQAAQTAPRPDVWTPLPHQRPPADDDWDLWLLLGGRGCIAPWIRIFLPDEGEHVRVDELARRSRPITVLALTSDGPRPVQTDGAPFLRGWADLWEIETEDGRRVTVTDRHRFLSPQGWLRAARVRVGQLLGASAPALLPGDSDGQSRWPGDALRWTGKGRDSRPDCLTCLGSDGRQLRAAQATVQGLLPSQGDAGERIQSPTPGDARALSGVGSRPYQRTVPLPRSSSCAGEPWPADGTARDASELSGQLLPTRVTNGQRSLDSSSLWHGVREDDLWGCRHGGRGSAAAGSLLVSSPDSPVSALPLLGACVSPSGRKSALPLQSRSASPPDGRRQSLEQDRSDVCSAWLESTAWSRVWAIRPAGFGPYYDLTVPVLGELPRGGIGTAPDCRPTGCR